jgi:hypothetical protein
MGRMNGSSKILLLACTIFLQLSRIAHAAAPIAACPSPFRIREQNGQAFDPEYNDFDGASLTLRGGFGVLGMSGSNVKTTISTGNLNAGQAGGFESLSRLGVPASQEGSASAQGTAFTKIVYAKLPGESPKTVEVVGSWSKFKQRSPMTRASNGDYEIIIELPRGQHELKFVVNGETWRCHPDLETRKEDGKDNTNNVIVVDNVARPSAAAQGSLRREDNEVYVPSKSSIDMARDVVLRLEQEQKLAQEKLAKGQQQLMETLKEELQAGALSLEKQKKLVVTFNEAGNVGLKLVHEAGETKKTEILSHMSKIRQILDDKERIALETVENEMKRRLSVLSSEVNVYGNLMPDLGDLLDQTHKAIKLSQTDGETFITTANALVVSIQEKTAKAAALSPPTDNVDFENLSLNVM